jgi:uncharacterized protein
MTTGPNIQATDRGAAVEPRDIRRVRSLLMGAVVAFLLPTAAIAQSFDCGQAHDAVERTICGSSRLRQLDSELARSYAGALRRDAERADSVRQAQRSWSKLRSACMASAHTQSGPSGDPEQCLADTYANRLAALTPVPASSATPPSADMASSVTAAPSASTAGTAAAVPGAAVPPPRSQAQSNVAGNGTTDASGQSAESFAQIHPATGLPAIPDGAATLERERFPTAGETDVLLHVTTPGRFAIRAESPTGTALQLVDMLSGPGDRTGWPGKQDGRIDALLDIGTYKVRAFGDPAATGDTRLSVTAFTAAGPAQIAPGYQPVAMSLADTRLQAFWLVVGDSASNTRVEAAGRSLAALKLWRDGRDLIDVPESVRMIAPTPAHPLTDITLSGRLPPGTYLLTAYGGPSLPWSDGAADEPFYLRTGRSTDLLTGGAASQVSVFGTEVFDTPPDASRALLILPKPAEAHLRVTSPDADGGDTSVADLTKNDRTGLVFADLLGSPERERSLSLEAAAGQAFVLRPLSAGGFPRSKPGDYWFGAAETMNGGDEAPAAAILTRVRANAYGGTSDAAPEVLAAPGVPTIGPGKAWRVRFNLRGETALLFQATDVVTVAVRAEGPPVTPLITTIQGAIINMMGDGRTATSWALSPGWYTLVLTAKPDAIGILDLTLGPPGLIPPEPDPPGPLAPILPLGEHKIEADVRFNLLTNRVPGGAATLLARAIPVELGDGPLIETLSAGAALNVTVHARTSGVVVARDIAGGAALETRAIGADAAKSITLAAADQTRTLAIALLPPPPVSPNPAPAPPLTALRDGEPAFLDLDRDAQASFALTVGTGGLYRIETIGRLKTEGSIGTSFIPSLGEATANGIGANMLLQRYLRAGSYRLDVSARDSSGRLGVSASATPLTEGAGLLPGGTARATLTAGRGVAFPIQIATSGRYHLDVLGDGRVFSARLEDSGGWPLRAAGDLASVDEDFLAGDYRLIVQPPAVQARVVTRLRRIEPPLALTGHGPHALPFDAPQSLEWREALGRDDPRAPDVWTFALAGPAKVTMSITGDGMAASLLADATGAGSSPLGRLMAGTPLIAELPAGTYQVAASSLGRNDRLAYRISLHTEELQPDTPRNVKLPVEVPLAVATSRVVTLTSFGDVPVRAELRDDAGHVLASAAGRTDDWNIALSRFLPAGRYRLALAPLVPPSGGASVSSDTPNNANQDDAGANASSDSTAGDDENQADQPMDQNPGQDQANNQPDQNDQPDQQDQADQPARPPARTQVTLFLPPDSAEVRLVDEGSMQLPGTGIQHVTLPTPTKGSLLVAAAEAPVELILALEQQGADAVWHTIGQDQGLAPVLGVPVGNATTAWRISVWTVDGGTVPVRVAARTVSMTPAAIGTVPLAPVVLGGITRHWSAALVADPGALMLRLTEPNPGLLASSAPEQQAAHPDNGSIVAQSDAVWLMAPDTTPVRLAPVRVEPGSELTVSVPAAGRASLPVAAIVQAATTGPPPSEAGPKGPPPTRAEPTEATLCAYVAASGLGQPGLEVGRGMGVAPGGVVQGSAFALCGGPTLTAWNAGGDSALRLRLRRQELTLQPEVPVDQAFAGTVPPHAAVPLRLAAGMKRLDVSLAAGGAMVAGWRQPGATTVWAGEGALSRSQIGAWTDVLLVNTGDAAAPVALTTTEAEPLSLASGSMFRRFYGAGGSFELPLAAQSGQRLVLAGDASALVRDPSGRVRRGAAIPLDGPATAIVTHGAGPLALWIEGPGVSPWPETAPRDVALPARLSLEQEAMTLRLTPGAPMLLRLASTAPVILAIGTEPPVLFGKGAALARYLADGETTLRLLSPQDGPLSGTLELTGSPLVEVGEGLGAPVAIPPGGAAVFSFKVTVPGPVGLGVRADPDRLMVRLLNERGETLQRGVSMLRQLEPGRYLLEASVPPDAPTTLARPAVLGIVPHLNPPPPDVVRGLLLAAGLAPPNGAR